MNTVQTVSNNQEKLQSLIRNQRNEKRKESEVSSESTTKQANNIKKKEQSSLFANKKVANETDSSKNQDKLEISDYLKIVSRLENKLNLGQLEDKDLENISASLEEKILSLTDMQKTRLRSMPFFKDNGIENIKDLKKTLFELFKDVSQREMLFDFLKSPEFMSMLTNESDKPATYSANLIPNSATSTKVQV